MKKLSYVSALMSCKGYLTNRTHYVGDEKLNSKEILIVSHVLSPIHILHYEIKLIEKKWLKYLWFYYCTNICNIKNST